MAHIFDYSASSEGLFDLRLSAIMGSVSGALVTDVFWNGPVEDILMIRPISGPQAGNTSADLVPFSVTFDPYTLIQATREDRESLFSFTFDSDSISNLPDSFLQGPKDFAYISASVPGGDDTSEYIRFEGLAPISVEFDVIVNPLAEDTSGGIDADILAAVERSYQALLADIRETYAKPLSELSGIHAERINNGYFTGTLNAPEYVLQYTPDAETEASIGDLFDQSSLDDTAPENATYAAPTLLEDVFAGEDIELRLTAKNDTVLSSKFSAALISVYAGAGDDLIDIGEFDIFGDPVQITEGIRFFGEEGNDSASVWSKFAHIDGGVGNDTIGYYALEGGSAESSLSGGAGDDEIYGRYADGMMITGGAGNDNILGDQSSVVTLSGGEGNDYIIAYSDGSGNIAATVGQTFDGGAGDDTLVGSNMADTLIGGAGDDRFNALGGADVLRGGEGYDRFQIEMSGAPSYGVNLIEDNGGLIDILSGTFGVAANEASFARSGTDLVITLNQIATNENVGRVDVPDFFLNPTAWEVREGTLQQLDSRPVVDLSALSTILRVDGTSAAENVNGSDASELIDAGDGSDWITPGAGSDTIDGGNGRDMLSFVTLADTFGRTNVQYRIDLDLTAGTATTSGTDVYQITGVERVTGSIFADRIKGDAGDNQLRGLGDFDWFIATTGADTIDGGTGQDMISYVDWLNDADNTADPFNEGGAPPENNEVTGVVVDLNDASNNTNLAAGHTYIDVERITGSGRQDVFYGDDSENDFRGLGDYDWFVSSTGGRERYFGGDGIDTVTYFNASAGVIAGLANGARVSGEETGRGVGGDAALDLFFSIEGLVGSTFNDTLSGSAGRNNLSGLDGDDFIYGFGGIDQLKGGLGNDFIDGGDGSDYALYDGNLADFTVTKTSSNEVTITGAEGIDTLVDVEYFRFADGDVTIWELML